MANCIETVAKMLASASEVIQPLLYALEDSVKRASSPKENNGNGATANVAAKHQEEYSKLRAMMDPNEEMLDTDGKETPVDVLDVHF